MAKFSLIPYKKEGAPHITFSSELNTSEEAIYISYKLQGELAALDLGTGTPKHARVIKLWEKSCFELFIKNAHDSYMEFNFSPDFEWNAFYFAKKGDALAEYARMDKVDFDILLSLDVFHLIVKIDKKKFPLDFFQGPLKVGITSVIKNKQSELSYWALSHCDTRPNFHDFRSYVDFTLDVSLN